LKKILALTGITLYVAFVAYYQIYQREKGANQGGYDQKFFFKPQQLNAIKLHSQNFDITLSLKNGRWWVTEPFEYMADQEFIEKSIRIMDQVIVDNVFRKSKVDYYGFDPGQALIQFIHDDGEVRRFIVGEKEAPQNKIYLLNMDTEEVLVVHNVWGQLIYFPKNMFFAKSLPIDGDQIKAVDFYENQVKSWEVKSKSVKKVEVEFSGQTHMVEKAQLLWFFRRMSELNLSELNPITDDVVQGSQTLKVTTENGSTDFIFDEANSQVFIPKKRIKAVYDQSDLKAMINELKKAVGVD
jgi:hypothetical protein